MTSCTSKFTDFYVLRKDVQTAAERVEEVRATTGLERLEADLGVLERNAADSSLWDDPLKAQEILLQLTDVKDKIKLVKEFKSQVSVRCFFFLAVICAIHPCFG